MILKRLIAVLMICLFTVSSSFANSFTDRDRELLLKLSTDTAEIKGRLSEIDRRFDLIDKRIEQVDKSINQLYTFLWILTGIFTSITLATISLLFWDRKTFVKEDKKLEIVLKKYNLL